MGREEEFRKDNDWAWAYDDGDRSTSVRYSDERKWAKDDIPLDIIEQYHKCRACGGTDTVVIYHKSGGTADGTVVEEETLCKDCGKYTQYHFDDRV